MGIRMDWADFRIPPINLWVMPEWNPDWLRTGDRQPHHQAPSLNTSLLHRRFLQLLITRGREG